MSSREDLERLFGLSLDMLCIAGFDGYFKRLNPAWERTLGFTTEELLAKPYLEFIHPDDREATVREAQKISTTGASVFSFENRYLCKDGTYKWLSWTSAPFTEQQIIYATARDITERKEAEDALRKSEERLRLAQEAAHIGTWNSNLVTGELDWSESVAAMFGFAPGTFGGTRE